jgi:hypothetical protein
MKIYHLATLGWGPPRRISPAATAAASEASATRNVWEKRQICSQNHPMFTGQGDKIGRFFAPWVIYFVRFFKTTEVHMCIANFKATFLFLIFHFFMLLEI